MTLLIFWTALIIATTKPTNFGNADMTHNTLAIIFTFRTTPIRTDLPINTRFFAATVGRNAQFSFANVFIGTCRIVAATIYTHFIFADLTRRANFVFTATISTCSLLADLALTTRNIFFAGDTTPVLANLSANTSLFSRTLSFRTLGIETDLTMRTLRIFRTGRSCIATTIQQ
jgi:hypothetical protein